MKKPVPTGWIVADLRAEQRYYRRKRVRRVVTLIALSALLALMVAL